MNVVIIAIFDSGFLDTEGDAIFAREPITSSKQVIAPPFTTAEYFRPNEFDIGAFGTYATGVGSGENADVSS